MTAAIFGLAGVIVGGLISGGATYLMARRKEKVTARASARLLEEELAMAADVLGVLTTYSDEEAKALSPEGFPAPGLSAFPFDRWLERQELLAETLEAEDWRAVSGAYRSIRI